MVKVQKANTKTIKTAKLRKHQVKATKINSSKETIKKVGKTLEVVAKNKAVKDVKQKSTILSKKPKTLQKTVEIIVPKKNVIAAEEEKKKPIIAEGQEKIKNITQKKKQIVTEDQIKVKKTVPKKTAFAANIEKKKLVATKRSPLVAKVEKRNPLATKAKKKQKAVSGLAKDQTEERNQNLNEVTKDISSPLYEPVDFDEEKFKQIVSSENIKKISKALKVLVEKEVSKKKTSIFSDYKYFLNISSYKIPNCPKRMVKLNVKHSLVDTETDDVVMIVSDLQRGAKIDYELTSQHYEDLLRENDIENIKIVPFNQLRNEVTSYEAKRKFANTYDYFLCDGRIIGHAVGFCGNSFQKPRTTIHAVNLNNPKTYKGEIERALKRTSYRQLQKGDMISIPVGNHRFGLKHLAENIEGVIKQLKTIFPGGYANIRNIYLKIDIKGTSSLPLYVSLAGAPAEDPNVIGPREQRMIKLKKVANDILCNFSISKTGDFVKLNKTQVKRKQQIREARTALSLKENIEVEENSGVELNPPLKKKTKQVESPSNTDDGSESGTDIESDNSELSDED